MGRKEILENRLEIGLKLCRQIRQNYFQLINAKNFTERPYWDGKKRKEYYLQKFYNAADINGLEKFATEEQTLEEVLDFLIVREILETDREIISLQDEVDAVKNYAAKIFQDELVQM